MTEPSGDRAAIWFAVLEILVFAAAFLSIAASVFGVGSFLSALSLPVRLLMLGFVGVEMLLPLWMLVDIRRHPGQMDPLWLHTVLIPAFNVFGFAAYRWKRNQVLEGSSDDDAEDSG